MNLIIIRHGQTIENVQGLIQGHTRGTLTDLGKQQSKETALLLKDESLDAIYSSDLERCKDTTKYLIKYHQEIPTHYTSALREINVGKFDKLPVKVPGFIEKTGAWIISYFHLKVPGVESLKNLRLRITSFLNEVYRQYPNGNVLIVTHGVTMRTIESILHEAKNIDISPIPNCEVWRMTMTKRLRQ
jgi:probable phosphoglycerate mutase